VIAKLQAAATKPNENDSSRTTNLHTLMICSLAESVFQQSTHELA